MLSCLRVSPVVDEAVPNELQPRVHRLAFEGHDTEDPFVDAAEGFLSNEAFQAFDSQRKFVQCQRAFG